MSENLLSLLDQLRAIATGGLTFTKNEYDIERYRKLMDIVAKKYSDIFKIPPEEIIEKFKKETGSITPKVGVDVAILNEDNEVLVLKRSDDENWCLLGGWMDIGETPLETATREAKEEAGIEIEPVGYIAINTKGPNTHPNLVCHQINILVASKPIKKATKINLSHEHSKYRWINLDENIKWHAGHELLVGPIKKFMKNGIFIP